MNGDRLAKSLLAAVFSVMALANCGSSGGGGSNSGTLYPASEFATGAAAAGVAAADVNGDDLIDLMVANQDDASVSVLLGNGDGTFQERIDYPAPDNPFTLTCADMNGDGANDIVVVGYQDRVLAVLLGNGDGTFQSPLTTALDVITYSNPFLGDLNGDDILDVVTANAAAGPGDGAVSVYIGNGDGTFERTSQTFVQKIITGIRSIGLGDLNGDGVLDMAVPNPADEGIGMFIGNGDGTFQPEVPLPIGESIFSGEIADIDNNGDLDIVAAELEETFFIMMGHGDGTFDAPISHPVDYGIGLLRAEYLNADEYPDILMMMSPNESRSGFVQTMIGRGDGTFEDARLYESGGRSFQGLAVADVNGDADNDIVVPLISEDLVTVLFGNGDGTLDARRVFPVGDDIDSLLLGDFDGDGLVDLVLTPYDEPEVQFWRGDGSGEFNPTTSSLLLEEIRLMAAGDLNNDGVHDLVASHRYDYRRAVYLGQGDGTFALIYNIEVEGYENFSLGLINDDEILDMVIVDSNAVILLPGVGDGTFAAPIVTPAESGPGGILIGDFDGDRVPDLVVNAAGDGLSSLAGNGDGTFQEPRELFFPLSGLTRIAAGDFNRDGISDVAFVSRSILFILLSLGGGEFASPVEYPLLEDSGEMVVADLNGDNHQDVVVTHGFHVDKASLLLGNGDGTFQEFTTIRLAMGDPICVGFVNGDRRPDLVAFDDEIQSVVVLLHE